MGLSYKIKRNSKTTCDVIFTQDTNNKKVSITVPLHTFRAASNDIDRLIYYREDVVREIELRVEDSALPKTALKNTKYIDAVTEQYSDYREDAEGDADGMNWRDCLYTAFNEIHYSDFEN